MALEINAQHTGVLVEVDAKLWLTADRDRLVPDGHPDAAFLYCTPGMQVPRDEAERYGLLGGTPTAEPEAEADLEPEGKAVQAPPNKARSSRRK
ncbi:hypothetical protein MOQ72_29130 [Saccharopolyspora sp. K220]|nr:hypothetical protein [Saccharopolyspora soli]